MLKDKQIVLTGADGFLGKAMTRSFVEKGAHVYAIDKKFTDPQQEKNVERFYGDVARKKHMLEISEKIGRVDVLINNASAKPKGFSDRFEDYTTDTWNAVMRTNVTGTYVCCQVFGKKMAKQGVGNIINMASVHGVVAPEMKNYVGVDFSSPAVYSASKAAVVMLTRYLANYWGPCGIRCNAVSPGGVFNHQDAGFVGRYSSQVPLGRMAELHEVTGLMDFLASDRSSYFNGHNFVMDGGLSNR